MSPTPGLISEYLILFSTKLFPPFTLSQGQDEACWSTGKGWRRGMRALQPSSFPCSQPQHKSIGSILRFGPVPMGSETGTLTQARTSSQHRALDKSLSI